MKKIVCIAVAVLMIATIVYAQKKIAFTPNDLPGLKGTWKGMLSLGQETGMSSPATLEIMNDAVPLKAKITVENVPPQVAQGIGIMSGQNVSESDSGKITTQGTILFPGAVTGNFISISKTGSKDKISIWYMFNVMQGTGTFTKK